MKGQGGEENMKITFRKRFHPNATLGTGKGPILRGLRGPDGFHDSRKTLSLPDFSPSNV